MLLDYKLIYLTETDLIPSGSTWPSTAVLLSTTSSLSAQVPNESRSSLPLDFSPSSSSPTIVTTSSNTQSHTSLSPTGSNARPQSTTLGTTTETAVMQSTEQGLKPVPPAATQVGDPNGHHEITEPNFSATKACRGCSPVIEISATGWLQNSAGEMLVTATVGLPQVTVGTGLSNVIISQDSIDGNFIVDGSTTLTLGQTVTIDDTRIAIQTSAGRTHVLVGTSTLPLEPEMLSITDQPDMTAAPVLLPPVLTLGKTTITANERTEYAVADQTLSPGGAEITVSGTILSLAPSATALIIDGQTSSLTPLEGGIYTTVAPVAWTFNNQVYTTNRAGWIVLGPSATLIPGGPLLTLDGTTLSLDHSGTAVLVQGSTVPLQPVTAVVTLTRSPSLSAGGTLATQRSAGDGYRYPTSTGKAVPMSVSAASRSHSIVMTSSWFGSVTSMLIFVVWVRLVWK